MQEQLSHYENKLRYEIDSWDLNNARENGERIIVVDARSQAVFDAEHITGAVCLPHRDMNKETTAHLDKEALYVTYCDGIGCNGSTKGALNLTRLGFRVKELMGGIAWWKQDGYPVEGTGLRSL